MLKCKECGKELIKNQKSTCSRKCRNKYVKKINTGRPSPFKGKKRWTEEQKKAIGERQKGKKLTPEHIAKIKAKCIPPSRKGIPHTEEYKQSVRGENSPRWKGGRNTRKDVLARYGLTLEGYDKLFGEHNGVCAICGKPELVRKNLSIDHDHNCCNSKKSCGKCIRGLLCHRCNQMLGMAYDNIEILKSAIKYLEN